MVPQWDLLNALTAAYAMLTSEEATSLIRVMLILGMIGCVVGLKVVTH
jgi:quaternary ammonium compound-resistance protein SugE